MGWSLGKRDGRDIGYGVPAYCDQPGCYRWIDRGLAHLCGEGNSLNDDCGCGLFFCGDHLYMSSKRGQLCKRCLRSSSSNPYPRTPDHPTWVKHKLTDESWQKWRDENPKEVEKLQKEMDDYGIA